MANLLIQLDKEIYPIIITVLLVAIIGTFIVISRKSRKVEIKVVNIMASTSFADHLDLGKVGLALNGFERRKGRFRAFTYRLEYPKVSVSIFKSGKVNFNGAKDIASITWAYKKISLGFKRVGIEVYDNSPIIISNMVAVYNMKKELNLPYIAMTLGLENVEYTPEFPDLVYRIEEPKVSMMLFASGKIICTGAKKESDIVDGIRIMRKTLKKANVM